MESYCSKQKHPLLVDALYSACPTLADFTADNKSKCKISIWNKLTLHTARNTACKNIENRLQTKQMMKNTTYKLILKNTKNALQHTGIQYRATMLENIKILNFLFSSCF